MEREDKTLCELTVGQGAMVTKLTTTGAMRRRLLDLGLIEGTKVICLYKSAAGNPAAFLIRGATIALRNEDSRSIFVS